MTLYQGPSGSGIIPFARARAQDVASQLQAIGDSFAELGGRVDGLDLTRGNVPQVREIVATEGQTVFQFLVSVFPGYIDVFLNGARLQASDFIHSGATVTLATGVAADDVVTLKGFSPSVIEDAVNIRYGDQTVADALSETGVNVRKYGAKCDGTTLDDDALDAAIAYCAANGWPPLIIPGTMRLQRTHYINRLYDTHSDYWRVIGVGRSPGFHTTTAGMVMFDTDLPANEGNPKQPNSELVSWESIRFSASNETLGAQALGGGMMRQRFAMCRWDKLFCLKELTRFAQEWKFISCYATGWHNGAFFKSCGAFAVTSIAGKWQFSSIHADSGLWDIGDPAAATGDVGCDFIGDEPESINGTIYKANNCLGFNVAGGYHEGFKLLADFRGAGANSGINLSPGWADDHGAAGSAFVVEWGNTVRAKSDIPYCTGRLHNNTGLAVGALVATGQAAVAFQSDLLIPIRVTANSMEPSREVAAAIAGEFAAATQLEPGVSYVNSEAAFHSAKLPPARLGIRCVVVSTAAEDFTLFPQPGDRFSTTGIGASIAHVSMTTRVYRARDGIWYIGLD